MKKADKKKAKSTEEVPLMNQDLAELAKDHIFIIDKKLVLQYVNTYAASHLNRLPNEIIGKPLKKLFPPETFESQKQNLQKVFASGETVTAEERIQYPGKELWLNTRLIPIKNNHGDVETVMGIGRDITEHKLSRDLISHAKWEWERTVDSMPDLIAVIDNQYRIVRVNRAMANKLGVPVQKAAGLTCYEQLYALKSPPPFCPLVRSAEDNALYSMEIYEKHWGGNYLLSVTPVRDGNGCVTGCIYIGRHIARHERDEDLHRKNEQQMKLLMKNAEYIILIQDREGKYMFFSATPQHTLEADDVLGKTPFDFFEPTLAARISDRVNRVVMSGHGITQLNNLAWNGETISFFDQVSPLKDVSGNITAVATISRKITERKRDGSEKSDLPIDPRELTKREQEVIKLIASGLSNKEIADKLVISRKTVETHRARIMQKLEVHKVADLVKYAIKSGFVH